MGLGRVGLFGTWMMVGALVGACDKGEPESATTDAGSSSGSAGSTSGDPSSTSGAGTTSGSSASSTTGSSTTSATTMAGSSGGEETSSATTSSEDAWVEVGWGIDEFNAFDDSGTFPVYFGPQGLYMFTVPIRGGGFPLPADPYDYEDPNMPYVDLWLDVDGYNDGPNGHFSELTDYVLPMSPDPDMPGTSQYISVWLPIPETVDPNQLEGIPAQLHVELLTGQGEVLTADHPLMVGGIIDPGFG